MGEKRINHYNQWRKKVMERDGHKCTQCGSTERLAAHHLFSFTHFPDLRYEVENGSVLCESCHRKTENFGGGAIKYGKSAKH